MLDVEKLLTNFLNSASLANLNKLYDNVCAVREYVTVIILPYRDWDAGRTRNYCFFMIYEKFTKGPTCIF